jgi:hypothetical protein
VSSTEGRGVPKHGGITIGGRLVNCSIMPATSSLQLQNETSIVAPKATSSSMESYKSGMKHTEGAGETKSGLRKPEAAEVVGARAAGMSLSPSDGGCRTALARQGEHKKHHA